MHYSIGLTCEWANKSHVSRFPAKNLNSEIGSKFGAKFDLVNYSLIQIFRESLLKGEDSVQLTPLY